MCKSKLCKNQENATQTVKRRRSGRDIEIKLTPEEKAALDKSAAAVKELVGVINV